MEYKFLRTGEVRTPREGEYFLGFGCIVQAREDFQEGSYPILVLVGDAPAETGEKERKASVA